MRVRDTMRRSTRVGYAQGIPYGVQIGSVQTDACGFAFHRFSHMDRALREPLGHVRIAEHREFCHAAIHADEQDTRPVPGQLVAGAGDVLHDLQRRMFRGLLQANHVDFVSERSCRYAGLLLADYGEHGD